MANIKKGSSKRRGNRAAAAPAAATPTQVAALKTAVVIPQKARVKSLLDVMKDGREYESCVNCLPDDMNVVDEFRRALKDIEDIRGKPAILYAGNMVSATPHPYMGIGTHDELPFVEMVNAVDAKHKAIDVIVLTPGGSAQTASAFVDKLRNRFDQVSYIIPWACMSAGAIWVLSGDEIWMGEHSYIGPIDPQVPSKDGRLIPLQALWALIKKIQDDGAAAIASGAQPSWSHLALLRSLDPKELGDALSASGYSTQLAAAYLERWKLRHWTTHSSTGNPVTGPERKARAEVIASELCKHDRWKMHSHRLPRDIVENELKLKIEKCESVAGLDRAVRRLWALLYYILENTGVIKLLVSQDYVLMRQRLEAAK